jgi:DNA polymerase-3 subunit chi
MTDIKFHIDVPERVTYGARVVRKSLALGARLCVVAHSAEAQALSQHLWSVRPTEFVPHAIVGQSNAATIAASQVVIATSLSEVDHHDVLLNLLAEVPMGFERFGRLIELVGHDESDRLSARQRWRHYQSRGYPITTHRASSREVMP